MKIPSPEEIKRLLTNPPLFIADVTKTAAENEHGAIRHPYSGNEVAIAIGGDLTGGQVPVYAFNGQFLALGTPTTQVGETRYGEGFLSSPTLEDEPVEEALSNIKFLYSSTSSGIGGITELGLFDGKSYISLGMGDATEGAIANLGSSTTNWSGWLSFSGSVLPYLSGVASTEIQVDQPSLLAIGQGWGLSLPFGEQSQDPVTADVTQEISQLSLVSGIATQVDGTLETDFIGSGYPNWAQSSTFFVEESSTESFSMSVNNDSARANFQNNGPWDSERPYCPTGAAGLRVHIAIPLSNANTPDSGPNSNDDWHKGLNHYNYTPNRNLVHTSSPIEFVGGNTDDTSPWLNWNIPGATAGDIIPADPENPNYSSNAGALQPCGFSRQEWNDGTAPATVSGDIRLYSRTYRLGVEDWGGEFENLFGGQTFQSFNPCSSESCVQQYLSQFLAHETASGPLRDQTWVVEFEGDTIQTSELDYCGSGFSCPVEWNGPPPPPSVENIPDYFWRQTLLRSFEGDHLRINYTSQVIELPETEEDKYLYIQKIEYFLNDLKLKDETPLVAINSSTSLT